METRTITPEQKAALDPVVYQVDLCNGTAQRGFRRRLMACGDGDRRTFRAHGRRQATFFDP